MSNSRAIAWSIWIIGSIFYAYQYVLRVMPNLMLTDIMQQFHINAAVFGQFSGVYYIGYAIMHLPIGIMLDRYGPKKIMSGCILLTVIGLLPILVADHWIYPVLGRALIGIGSSAAILGTFKIIRMTFSEKSFPRMLSFSVTIGLIGAIYGGGPVSYMCTTLGYQLVVKIFAVLGLVLSAITYLIVPEMKSSHRSSVISDIVTVLTHRKVIALCCFAGLMVGPLEGFADVWGSAFLQQVYGLDSSIANYLPSMIFIGMCFGAPALSMIAEKTGNYIGSVIGAGIIMLVIFTTLVTHMLNATSIAFTFIIVGACCAYQILVIYKASTCVSESIAGLTTAVANMIIMLFGYAFHTIMSLVINTHGGINTAQSLIYGVSVIPITLSIGVAGFFILACLESGEVI